MFTPDKPINFVPALFTLINVLSKLAPKSYNKTVKETYKLSRTV